MKGCMYVLVVVLHVLGSHQLGRWVDVSFTERIEKVMERLQSLETEDSYVQTGLTTSTTRSPMSVFFPILLISSPFSYVVGLLPVELCLFACKVLLQKGLGFLFHQDCTKLSDLLLE